MKYSIFQFSQEKLLEHNLDVIDALILSWFSDFFAGSMEKRLFKDKDTDKPKLFGWVKLSKVLEDLPCIGINSEKGIKRRFDGFVEKGIMERNSIISQKGKKTYYKPTKLYESLINAEPNHTPEISSHDYENIHAEGKVSQGTKTTDAESKTSEISSHDYQNIHAQGNENIHAHDYQNIHALNNSPTRNESINDAAVLKTASEKIFGLNYFDPGFPQKAAAFLIRNKLEKTEWTNYLSYIRTKVSAKDLQNQRGYAYRLFFQNDIFQEYSMHKKQLLLLEKEKIQAEEQKKKICPACGCKFNPKINNNCPECKLPVEDFGNAKKVAKQKSFNKLSPEQQKQYYSEVVKFKCELSFIERIKFCSTEEGKKQRAEYIKNLDIKYGLVG